jgi:hypothetical protein
MVRTPGTDKDQHLKPHGIDSGLGLIHVIRANMEVMGCVYLNGIIEVLLPCK